MDLKDVPILLSTDATAKTSAEQVRNSPLLEQWFWRLRRFGQGITVHSVYVYAVHIWGEPAEIKMMHITAEATAADGRKLPGVAFLRGDTVDVLAALKCEGEYHVALLDQPRVAGAQGIVRSNPAGMIDTGESFNEAALRELGEETKARGIEWSQPIDLAAGLLDTVHPLLGSPGGSDERVYFLAVTANVTRAQLDELNDAVGGHDADEQTTVRILPLSAALNNLAPDGQCVDMKTVLSLLLFKEYLRFTASIEQQD